MRKFTSWFLIVVLCVIVSAVATRSQTVNRIVDQIVATTCTNQFIRSIVASGAGTCATVVSTDLPMAVQSDMETATSTTTLVSPGRTQNHPGVAKAWAYVTYSGATPTLGTNYNISSVSAGTTGVLTFNYTTACSGTSYAVFVSTTPSVANASFDNPTNRQVGSITISHFESTVARDPVNMSFSLFCDQ